MLVVLFFAFIAFATAAPIRDRSFSKYHSIDFDRYWTYDDIVQWMQSLNEHYPETTEVFQFGRTEQGRDIMGIRVTSEEHLAQETLPIIFVTAATSARDWITAMSAVNLIHMLVEYRHTYGEIVDNIDWYILPVANPDGYAFSMTEGNRDWIKNRRVNPGSDCLGANIERNFDHSWGVDINSSNDPCSANFRGPSATSEEEVRSIKFAVDAFSRIQPAYVTLKAGLPNTFNGLITYPYSYSNEAMPPNPVEAQEVAFQMSNNVRGMTGARFSTGLYSNMAQPTAGTSMDYAAAVDLIPLSYSIFTPPHGRFGWDVEEFRINAIVDQVFFAIENLGRYVLDRPIDANKN